MHPTRALTLGSSFLTALTAMTCQRAPMLEEIPAGTEVTIKMQDGRRVKGPLVSVDPQTIVVSGDRANGRIWVARTDIAQVRSGANVASPADEVREVIAPRGSTINAQLDMRVASDESSIEQPVRATVTAPLVAGGVTIAPLGSTLLGTVTAARGSGRVRGRAALGLRFDRLWAGGVIYDIRTAPMRWVAEATKRQDAVKVGVGAASGAVIGAIAGGGKGAAVGSAIGAGGGSAVVLATKGEEIRLESGTRLLVELTEPFKSIAPAPSD